jgi:hypothetical protein
MGFRIRVWLLGTVACVIVAFSASGAQAAGFEVETFAAVNCIEGHETCAEETVGNTLFGPLEIPKEPTKTEAEAEGYTQAGGHIPFGVTDFIVTHTGDYAKGEAVPTGVVTHVRTDVAPGLATSPIAVAQCTQAEFGEKEAIPGTGFYAAPTCNSEKSNPAKDTVIGEEKATVYAGPGVGDVPLVGHTYNLVPSVGRAAEYGTALELPKLLTGGLLKQGFEEAEKAGAVPGMGGFPSLAEQAFLEAQQYYAHTLIEGNVEWGKEENGTNAGDYHDYFEVIVSPKLPLLRSRLVTYGRSGDGAFLTNATSCPGHDTTTLKLTTAEGTVSKQYTAPIGLTGCNLVPFEPGFVVTPETTRLDQPDGITAELSVPHVPVTEPDSAQLEKASVTLPEGMTLNPSAGAGLEACTAAEARIHSPIFGVACPEKSEIGTVTLNVPTLPDGSLTGNVFLGGPESGPITKSPYTVYVNAESTRYGVDVRLQGEVITNEATGRVTAVFSQNPEQPFSNLVLHFKGGALAPIANPLVCGTAKTETSLIPYIGTAFTKSPSSAFAVDSNGTGGACASPLPFALSQTTASSPTTGGAATSFTLNLGRADGQQYLSHVSAALPTGLVGKIPAVPLCPEPQASLGTCASTSQIGTATAVVGSGATPVALTGPVYLTGPTDGAPYGMTTAINAVVGPFSLGLDVVRTGISINQFTGRVTVAGPVPTIFKGIPLRLKALSVAVTTPGFLINPTNCGALATETTLTSSGGTTQSLSTPFQATNCSALAFKPKFTASSNGKTSRANGAALNAKISYPTGIQSNIKSVLVTVPKQLPTRLTTLHNACREAVFNQSPYLCPTDSRIGGATVTTPVLPAKLTGPAYFVSHGGAKFPDLDFVLTGNGVTVILVGTTNISKGITATNFASLPDVPVSSFEENLPTGKNSAVTAIGNICKQSLVMPTTITGQNGKVFKQNTKIAVSGCPVTIVSHAVRRNKAIVVVKVPAAGRVSGGGKNLKTVFKHPSKSQNVTLEVPLKGSAPLVTKLRVGFIPKAKGQKNSTAFVTILFR